MKWHNAKTDLPDTNREVIVCDGNEYSRSYTVAWLRGGSEWIPATDMLGSENSDGNCTIFIDCEVMWWAEIIHK